MIARVRNCCFSGNFYSVALILLLSSETFVNRKNITTSFSEILRTPLDCEMSCRLQLMWICFQERFSTRCRFTMTFRFWFAFTFASFHWYFSILVLLSADHFSVSVWTMNNCDGKSCAHERLSYVIKLLLTYLLTYFSSRQQRYF